MSYIYINIGPLNAHTIRPIENIITTMLVNKKTLTYILTWGLNVPSIITSPDRKQTGITMLHALNIVIKVNDMSQNSIKHFLNRR